jgi:GNAT superfamily N-acetyltransferase
MAEDNKPTNVVDEVVELENNIRSKYSDYLEKDIIQEYYASDPNKPGNLDTPHYRKRGIQLSYLEGDISRDFPYNKNTLFIGNLYIDETQRGQGIGSQIFDEIKQFADDNGLYIRLWNDEDFNTTFWEKKGFGIYETPRNPDRSWERTLPNYVLAPEGETLPVTPNRLDTAEDWEVNKLKRKIYLTTKELNTKYADVIDNDYGLDFELRDGRLHITDLYLKDTERGKGIGSEIFDEIKQFADNNNLEISLYNDGDFNTTFWENKGFQEWNFKIL